MAKTKSIIQPHKTQMEVRKACGKAMSADVELISIVTNHLRAYLNMNEQYRCFQERERKGIERALEAMERTVILRPVSSRASTGKFYD